MTSDRVVLVTGAPCSGKTTIANLLATMLAVPVLSREAVRDKLAGPGILVPEDEDQAVSVRLINAVGNALAKGSGLVVDAMLSVAEIVDLTAILESNSWAVSTVYTRAHLDVLRERIGQRTDVEGAMRELYRVMLRPILHDLSAIPGDHHAIDTDGAAPDAASRVFREIVEGRHSRAPG